MEAEPGQQCGYELEKMFASQASPLFVLTVFVTHFYIVLTLHTTATAWKQPISKCLSVDTKIMSTR